MLPLAERFDVHLLGTGLPSFWVTDMGDMQLTLGLSGWTTNDWTRGSALDLLAPPTPPTPELISRVAQFMQNRSASAFADIDLNCGGRPAETAAALNRLAHTGQLIHDLPNGVYRWRQIMPMALGEAELGPENEESAASKEILARKKAKLDGRTEAPNGGAVVTAITKSGTNQFKGSGYYFLRDDALDARNFFDRADKPAFNLKQFGGSLGGPIQRDRVFFFTNYEGSRKHLGATQTGTVPSAAFRSTVSPALGQLLQTVPLPTDATANPNVGIARVSGVTGITENIYSLRLDYRASDKDMLFGRFNVQKSLVDGPLFVLTSSLFAGQRQYAPITSGSGTVSYTRTLRSNRSTSP